MSSSGRTPSRAELDSHCDTCTLGSNCTVVYDTGQTFTVEPFLTSLGKVTRVPLITGAIAYDCPTTYQTYVLFFHQALHIKHLDHHLLCPGQMRQNGITVNDVPLINVPANERTRFHHSIYNEDLHIPLQLEGTVSFFNTRAATHEEINNNMDYIHIHMTSESPWDPTNPLNYEHESAIRASLDSEPCERGRIVQSTSTFHDTQPRVISKLRCSMASAAVDVDSLCVELEHFAVSSTQAVSVTNRKGKVSAETLAKRWRIGLETARKTIARTTQRAVRDFTTATGTRRLRPYAYQLRYPRLNVDMYVDVVKGKCKSLLGNTCCALYCTPFHWMMVDPIATESEVHKTLDTLFKRVGFPRSLIPDNAKSLTEGEFKTKANKAQVPIHPIEAYTSNANIAEDGVREVKRWHRRTMAATNTPKVLWDLSLVYHALLRSHTALNIRELQGEVPDTIMTGNTSDISFLAEFGWYEYVWHLSPEDDNLERKQLGRYCGPSFDVGDVLTARILTPKGKFIFRTSVFPLKPDELMSDEVKKKIEDYEISLKDALREGYLPMPDDGDDRETTPAFEPYEPTDEGDKVQEDLAEADEIQHEAFDKYISARVYMPQGDKLAYGTVRRRKRDNDGNLIGRSNTNPILDTSIYEVEFDSGETEAYSANIIAESLYAQTDDEGYTHYTVEEIVDHRKDSSAIAQGDDAFVVTRSGRKLPKRTTRGWEFCLKYKDESTSWVKLKDLKDAEPILLAEYAVNNNLQHEPAFAWWVPYTLRKRDRIIKAMKKRYFRVNQKYGIELPKTVKRALEIDEETGTTFWRDALTKEMKNVAKAFEVLDEGQSLPAGTQEIECHIVFDIKSDFSRKCRYVAGGHKTDPPASITYASVVSRESVRIAFLVAALNGLDIQSADIGNAYINAPCRERIGITCGPEWGPLQGRKAKVVRALYGLKSSGAAWRSHLAQVISESLGFTMCKADNDVWIRRAQKPNGEPYYEYLLVYTDDVLCISMDPNKILCYLDQHFLLKPDSIGPPKQYLGASVSKYKVPDGAEECWCMGSEQYVKEAIRNVENWLAEREGKLKTKASSPLSPSYAPELDVTPYCNDEDTSYYHQQIGILRWAVELGRIDIATEVSIMAGFSAAPRVGHLNAVFDIFAYLKRHTRSRIVFDPIYPNLPQGTEQPDWTDFYKDVKEQVPLDAPEPLGKPVEMTAFVDSDHAGDKVTRRSRTGVLIFLNRAPIVWYSKKQNSIETSSFGSEFSAMKTGVELIEGLRYKLRMMGVPLDGPANVRADNLSVVKNSSSPESTLKKKSNSIAYHYVRERAAANVIRVAYEHTSTNLADMLTKIQAGPVRKRLVEKVLF